MSTVHGASPKALKHFRDKPASLSVYWVYIARVNIDNVAWPSLRGLATETGWDFKTCGDGREFLVEHQALERIRDYIRPSWRDLPTKELRRLRNLDKAEYFRPTGTLLVGDKRLPLLYIPQDESMPSLDDDPRRPSSTRSIMDGDDHGRRGTELSTSSYLDSISKLSSRKGEGGDPAFTERELFYAAYEFGFPPEARPKVADSKVNCNTAKFLYANGYQPVEVMSFVAEKIKTKPGYLFQFLSEDLPQAKLAKMLDDDATAAGLSKRTPPPGTVPTTMTLDDYDQLPEDTN